MKKTTIILPFFLLFIFSLSAQPPTKTKADNILEGGRLLVDIVKVFKKKDKNKSQKEIDCEEELSELCFQNKAKSTVKIKVEQKGKENAEVTELIIPTSGKECSFVTIKGIYKYEISLPMKDGIYEPIRKGEFNVRNCIEVLIKVEDL